MFLKTEGCTYVRQVPHRELVPLLGSGCIVAFHQLGLFSTRRAVTGTTRGRKLRPTTARPNVSENPKTVNTLKLYIT